MSCKDDYSAICEQKNDLPLFHKNWWLDAACSHWDARIVMKGAHVAGVWPYCVEKKAGITISRNPALTPYMGPHVFFPKDLKESKKDNYEHEIITELLKMMPAIKVWHTACRPGLKQAGLFKEQRFRADFRQTFIIDLRESEDAILERLHEDFRRSVRKVAAEMTITNEPAALPLLYAFQSATLSRKEMAINYPMAQIQRMFDVCMQHDACALWVARKNDEVQAIIWNMWDDVRAYYLVGSKNPQVKDNHAMTALIWHAIRHSKQLGKVSLDFEGSMIPSVERFFRNFGGRRELYPVLQRYDSLLWRLLKLVR